MLEPDALKDARPVLRRVGGRKASCLFGAFQKRRESMTSKTTEKSIQQYLTLMHEVVIRVDLVAQACEGKLNLTPPYALEYSYLQFRRICELIALGCLQVHGDLPSSQKRSTKREWSAIKIMKILDKDYPGCFPQCATAVSTPKGLNIKANSKPNALTRDEFKKLYTKTGEVLHRGTIRSLELFTGYTKQDYQAILDWQKKIVDLLNQHVIGRSSGKTLHLFSLKSENGYPKCDTFNFDRTNGVSVHTTQAKGPKK